MLENLNLILLGLESGSYKCFEIAKNNLGAPASAALKIY
jgi:hypothetical protein